MTFRGQQVQYLDHTPCIHRHGGRNAEKVWFPKGPAAPEVLATNQPSKLGDFQDEEKSYRDDVKEQYKLLFETGKFEPGKMPLVPPKREWCLFDF